MENNNNNNLTPEKKSSGFWKRFGAGLAGGVIGGVFIVGVAYLAMGSSLSPSTTTNSSGSQNSSGETTVSPVKVDVNSDITEAVDKVQDAVVSVINLQKQQQSSGFGGLFGSQQSESNNKNASGSLEEASEGSGVIYKKEGDTAYIVTNNHVVEGQDGLEVLLKDGTKVSAELVGTDVYTDLAVLKIKSDKVSTVATFGDSDKIKVGEPAIAIGSPLGSTYANSVTSGIVSSLNRQVVMQSESGETVANANAIQTDAAINPGNSGGPLINTAGQVIGINSSKIGSTQESTSSVSVEGIGFAIPSNEVVNVINQLESDGKVTRPALGISMRDLSSISAQQQKEILKVPSSVTNGVVVIDVNNATPAEKAGLKQYDVITKIDGKEVSSGVALQSALYKKKVGDSVKITFYRGETEKTVTVDLTIDQSALQSAESKSETGN
ncbi:serine protease do-like htrA [Enterococcus phoeniculicola]|jgi:serine protease Do|uniref:Serine protease do-like htrA n=1 Tax=Enterococcus phoeniculicola ATCC BAA-412 TaxID=1158610 RepID=R3TIH8_9ENTE|nr:trypsin-like peptidase domain-containing protein [Enterococcus phoeniculicola]EOL41239.1 serine protease do-like htrA [Enterococcus phoeniculicola ATCC BAA-412]EOT78623.1 serine protease do-like htrA [Enterococcus phoeniculicola ATCC BAA-412]OJG70619.1 serine protease do-like htrA [Enterococcus phoeniculicola]